MSVDSPILTYPHQLGTTAPQLGDNIFLERNSNGAYSTYGVAVSALSAVGITGQYTPGNPGNWASTPPTTIQQALDRLAAKTPGA